MNSTKIGMFFAIPLFVVILFLLFVVKVNPDSTGFLFLGWIWFFFFLLALFGPGTDRARNTSYIVGSSRRYAGDGNYMFFLIVGFYVLLGVVGLLIKLFR